MSCRDFQSSLWFHRHAEATARWGSCTREAATEGCQTKWNCWRWDHLKSNHLWFWPKFWWQLDIKMRSVCSTCRFLLAGQEIYGDGHLWQACFLCGDPEHELPVCPCRDECVLVCRQSGPVSSCQSSSLKNDPSTTMISKKSHPKNIQDVN